MKSVSPNTETVPVTELPDDVRIPLHSLQADLEYLIGRVIAESSCGPMVVKSMRDRLNQIEAYLLSSADGKQADLASFVPITGPGVDALENRKEQDNGPSEEQINSDLRSYLTKQDGKQAGEATLTGKVHTLKTWPDFFNDVLAGRKPFEWRIADRPFEVGDTLVLQEWVPERENLTCKEGRYTGREIRKTISYLFRPFATNKATVIMGLAAPPAPQAAMREALEWLRKIADLVDAEDACEPLDDAIAYAQAAIAALSAQSAVPSEGNQPVIAESSLPALRDAIIAHTRGSDMFWIGEILLNELKKETGFDGSPQNKLGQP
jgi:hypothetical protein